MLEVLSWLLKLSFSFAFLFLIMGAIMYLLNEKYSAINHLLSALCLFFMGAGFYSLILMTEKETVYFGKNIALLTALATYLLFVMKGRIDRALSDYESIRKRVRK